MIACALTLTSCLQDREKAPTVSSQSSWFEGVVAAKNLGGYPSSVKVSWNASSKPVTAYRIYSLEYDPASKNNKWTEIDEVTSDATSYIHSDLSAGQIYSYMVRAVDSTDTEDSNNKQVSTVAFDGIATAKATGKTTATVSLNTATGAFDEVRVYAQPSGGGAKTLFATVKGNVNTINVTGLHSGTKYKFSVSAYMNYLAAEDGNEVYIESQTSSDSFGTGSLTDTDYAYRGMMSVQAFGNAPHAPALPKVRLIRLTWPSFSGAISTTKYRVIRASTAYAIDMTTKTSCTSIIPIESSCVVNCTNVGSGAQTCEDYDVGPAPRTYNYTVGLYKTDATTGETWTESLPTINASDFYTKVSVPPDYMVLVQRDAANYEMCTMLGGAIDPRKHQRCLYSGIAATPYNSGPGKPALHFDNGYYDFGYNLFVDRYRLACNWTRNSASCGPNGCVGVNGIVSGGTNPPNPAYGNVGDSYFNLDYTYYQTNCYYKNASGWTATQNLTDAAEIRSSTTIDPGADGAKHNPVIAGMSPTQAVTLCNAQTTAYGNKRIMRRREYVHAAAFPTLPGEPGAITDRVDESNLRKGSYNASLGIGGQLPGFQRCASGNSSSMLALPTTIADLVSPTNTRAGIVPSGYSGGYNYLNPMTAPYYIGTSSTANCVSRWGSQDPVASSRVEPSQNTVLVDSFIRTNAVTATPATYAPVASDYDSGVVYDWGSYVFDGIIGPAIGTSNNGVYSFWFNTSFAPYTRFILPMGLAQIPPNTAYKPISELVYNGVLGTNAIFGDSNAGYHTAISLTATRYFATEGDFHRFSMAVQADGSSTRYHAWCAVEAE